MQVAGTYQRYLHTETLRVVVPYMVLGTIAFIWAFLVLMTKFPVLGGEEPQPGRPPRPQEKPACSSPILSSQSSRNFSM